MHEFILNLTVLVGWALLIKKFIYDAEESVARRYERATEDLGRCIQNEEWTQREILKRIETELKKLNSGVNGCPTFVYQSLTSEEFNARVHMEARKRKEQGDDI